MPEVIFSGAAGRLEGRYTPASAEKAPIALLLHPHPQHGGTMNNKVVYTLFHAFLHCGFAALRFNFRGVGRSQGHFDRGEGELADAASALDWLQAANPNARACWVGGFSFGAWIGMQLLMRRPEIASFVAVAPPAGLFDFGFLAPCPSSGLIVQGDQDQIVSSDAMQKLIAKLKHQRDIEIDFRIIGGADHFFQNRLDELGRVVEDYVTHAEPKRVATD
jgi:alpha/beta superfamily hydrolase